MVNIDVSGAVIALGLVFWLAGGASWVSEKTRKLKLDNDKRDQNLKVSSSNNEFESNPIDHTLNSFDGVAWKARREKLFAAISLASGRDMRVGEVSALGLLSSLNNQADASDLLYELMSLPGAGNRDSTINGTYSKVFLEQLAYTLGDESIHKVVSFQNASTDHDEQQLRGKTGYGTKHWQVVTSKSK